MNTKGLGNTRPTPKRVRNYCFTLNNYTEDDIKHLMDLRDCQILFAKEVGEENKTPHLQGMIIFKNARTIKGIKRINERIHWEVMKGTIEQSIDYCTKEADDKDIYSNFNWQEIAHGTKKFYEKRKLTFEEMKTIVENDIKEAIADTVKHNTFIMPPDIMYFKGLAEQENKPKRYDIDDLLDSDREDDLY